MIAIIKKIHNTFFSQSLDIHVKFFNLATIIGIVAFIAIAILFTTITYNPIVVIIDLLASLLLFIILIVAQIKKCYRLCTWILVVTVFMVEFPLMFFITGGHRGGMMCFFILGIAFSILTLKLNKDRIIAVIIELAIYISCFLLCYFIPNLTVGYDTELGYFIDAIICFSSCVVLIIIALYMRIKMQYEKQIIIEEQSRELEARNAALDKYDKMKNEFLATVAHEINTPLSVIAAYSNDTLDVLEDTTPNPEDIAKNQQLIIDKVKLIDNILLDIMDSTAIESGRLSLSRELFDLEEFLKKICDSFVNRLGQNKLVYVMQPKLPQVWADPHRIEQVITNLLTNAARSTDNGTITVSLSLKDGCYNVSVSDTGTGMAPDELKSVMRRYASTKSKYWRHGIGLYISRQIAVAHDGDLHIESEKGVGTTVTLYFRG